MHFRLVILRPELSGEALHFSKRLTVVRCGSAANHVNFKVRPIIGMIREFGLDKSKSFYAPERSEWTFASAKISYYVRNVGDLSLMQSGSVLYLKVNSCVDMILQITAYWQVRDHRNPKRPEVILRSNAGQHQQLCSVNRTCTQNDLFAGVHRMRQSEPVELNGHRFSFA